MAQHAPALDMSLPFSVQNLSTLIADVGKQIVDFAGCVTGVQEKGLPGCSPDLATDQDRHSQALLVEALHRLDPVAEILAEEEGVDAPQGNTYWVIDPIDGTNNFINGLPIWAINVGYVVEGVMMAAVTVAPLLGQQWHAVRGQGAWCGTVPLKVSDRSLRMASLGLTIQPRHFDRLQTLRIDTLLPKIRCTRILGSMAVELAWCAQGQIDLWIGGGHYWDHGPGSLLVEEAGGIFGYNALGDGIHIAGAPPLVEEVLNMTGTDNG